MLRGPDNASTTIPRAQMVVDLRSITAHLPASIVAFFYLSSSDAGDVEEVSRVRDDFGRAYHLTTTLQPPLVRLDLSAGNSAPFTLVAS